MYYSREEQGETCRGGQTTQKAEIYLGDFSARAGLNAFPRGISLRSELGSPKYLREHLGTPAPT